MFKEGLIPRKENVPWTIDAQYVPGFDWLRNPEIRIVKDWHKEYWLGVEAGSPQAVFGGTNQGLGGVAGDKNPTVSFPCASNLDNAFLNPTGSASACTLDFIPDFTVKAAWDPHGGGWGHYEIFGLARGFRDRVDGGFGATPAPTTENNLDYGFSGGGGAILPIWGDKLQLQGNVLYGQGVGRYGTDTLADATINTAGGVVPLTGFSVMGGITSHNAIKDLDLYAYAGEDHVFSHVGFTGTTAVGFGNGTIDNSNCTNGAITNTNSTCAGQINDVWQVTGGFWHSIYDGKLGKVVWGMQDSFTVDTTPTPGTPTGLATTKGAATCPSGVVVGKGNLCGDKESADLNVVMMSFRYYPKYGTLVGTQP